MAYELVWEERGVVARFQGIVTDEEFVQKNLDEFADPRFESIEYELVICTDSMVFEPSSTTVRRVAAMDAQASIRKPKLAIAVVATQELIRGYGNMYRLLHETMGGPWEKNLFKSEEEAREWIAERLD